MRRAVPTVALVCLAACAAWLRKPDPDEVLARMAARQAELHESRGTFTLGDAGVEYRAFADDEGVVYIEERRVLAGEGGGESRFVFEDGKLVVFADDARRPMPVAPAGEALRDVQLRLRFDDGHFAGGRKRIDGTATRPDEQEIRVALRHATALREHAEIAVERFRCRGNEPFWNVAFDGATARWSALGDPRGERTFSGRFGRVRSAGTSGIQWRGRAPGGTLVAVLTPTHCLDTMSDEEPPSSYAARIEVDGAPPVAGCCRSEPRP